MGAAVERQQDTYARQPLNSGTVQGLLDGGGDGSYLRAQLLLNSVEVEPVIVGYEVDGQAQVAKSSRPADSVEIGLGVLGEVEIDDYIYSLDVDPASEQVCTASTYSQSSSSEVELY